MIPVHGISVGVSAIDTFGHTSFLQKLLMGETPKTALLRFASSFRSPLGLAPHILDATVSLLAFLNFIIVVY
jgi:hypothetical protein